MQPIRHKTIASRMVCPFMVIVFTFTSVCWAQETQLDRPELLKQIILNADKAQGDIRLLTSGTGGNPPGPRFIPASGLDIPDAVPFLLGVLQSGPDWTEEELPTQGGGILPHIARCYAVLSLGYIGDARAFDPLLATLRSGDYLDSRDQIISRWQDRYDIRRFAAFALGELGDESAVNPLISVLRETKWPECIFALTRLDAIQAARPIIEVASEQDLFYSNIHLALQYMLRTDFRIEMTTDGNFQIVEFPNLGEHPGSNIYRVLWQHWLAHGEEYAKQQFEKNYPRLKQTINEKPNAQARRRKLERKMLKGGVAALPYLSKAIDQEDEFLAASVFKLVQSRNPRKNQREGWQFQPELLKKIEEKPWWNTHLNKRASARQANDPNEPPGRFRRNEQTSSGQR